MLRDGHGDGILVALNQKARSERAGAHISALYRERPYCLGSDGETGFSGEQPDGSLLRGEGDGHRGIGVEMDTTPVLKPDVSLFPHCGAVIG
jgi:hypothetical protein